MRRSLLVAASLSLLASGCVYRWRPVALQAPAADWARAIEGGEETSYRVTRRARVASASDGETLRFVERDAEVRVEGSELRVDEAPTGLSLDDLLVEVSYVDHGLTALNTIAWSLAGAASGWLSIFATVLGIIAQNDCRCAPTR